MDHVEDAIIELVRDVDEEFALRRIDHGRLLRIGLTDSRTFPRFRRNNASAYLYVDKYEKLEEIISACILSSYIPGLTGPLSHKSPSRNGAVRRANKTMLRMLDRGFIKDALGLPIRKIDDRWMTGSATPRMLEGFQSDVLFWDGGLANVFPTIDRDTCIVTPFSGCFRNPSISPSSYNAQQKVEFEKSFADRPQFCLENLMTLRYIAFSSGSLALEKWFEQGFNDANKYLTGCNDVATDYPASSFQVITNEALAQGLTKVYTAAVRPQPIRGM